MVGILPFLIVLTSVLSGISISLFESILIKFYIIELTIATLLQMFEIRFKVLRRVNYVLFQQIVVIFV